MQPRQHPAPTHSWKAQRAWAQLGTTGSSAPCNCTRLTFAPASGSCQLLQCHANASAAAAAASARLQPPTPAPELERNQPQRQLPRFCSTPVCLYPNVPLCQLEDPISCCNIVPMQVQQLQQPQHSCTSQVCGRVVPLEAQLSPMGPKPWYRTRLACRDTQCRNQLLPVRAPCPSIAHVQASLRRSSAHQVSKPCHDVCHKRIQTSRHTPV